MAVQRNAAYLLVVVLCLASLVHGSSISKRRTPYYENDLADKQAVSEMRDYTNKLILRLIDAVIEDARERGASPSDLDDMVRKRSGIRKCFFHAVNCW
ncbi:hypothetical protein LSH36_23g07030 [Paralvinella palmiformis]|uniref:Uncharacterized protein n=1 Tax=Paralvinella palmiformis TaxID=53620 RepID=A0AAD9K9Z6_9ANNE|nr:hypothetical protein LSH36_23g07030 [Paralvinella palmiformis]